MEQKVLNIEPREKVGKGSSRRLRKIGKIPAVVYGKGMDAVPGTVSAQELDDAISGEGGRNSLITLKGFDTLDGKLVIVADILRDCLKGTLLHVDLHKITLEDKVKVPVAVSLVGTAIGVKEGGMLDFAMHSIEMECLPTQIPEHIDVDITDLAIGDSLHAGDIKIPDGVKILGDPMATVVSILGKPKEEAAPVEEAEA